MQYQEESSILASAGGGDKNLRDLREFIWVRVYGTLLQERFEEREKRV